MTFTARFRLTAVIAISLSYTKVYSKDKFFKPQNGFCAIKQRRRAYEDHSWTSIHAQVVCARDPSNKASVIRGAHNLEFCKRSCELDPGCLEIDYYANQAQCKLYKHACKHPVLGRGNGVVSYHLNREKSRSRSHDKPAKIKSRNKVHIRFLRGICGNTSIELGSHNFTLFGNLSQVFPESAKHCSGDAGFLTPNTMAPPRYCIRYVRGQPRDKPRFNQYGLENFMLRRWAATRWHSAHPIVIVPSPYMHCQPRLWHDMGFAYFWAQFRSFWDCPKLDEYFQRLKTKFYNPSKKNKPLIVVHIGYAWDMPSNLRLLTILEQLPKDFASRLVIASIDGSNIPARFRRDFALRRSTERPLFVTLPYPVGLSNAADFTRPSGAYAPSPRRPIAVYYTGRILNTFGFRPMRWLIRAVLVPYFMRKYKCDIAMDHDPKITQYYCLCAPGMNTNGTFCGQGHYLKDGTNPYGAVVASDFCLEPGGDTPTRSHFYLAVLAGCIPVIFDYECSHKTLMGLDFSNVETGWPWRHTAVHLNYSDFAVVYNASGNGFSKTGLRDFLKSLIAMPTERPDEFRRLRRGVNRAAKWMRYAMKDCEDEGPHCDAFSVFKHILTARARELEDKNASKTPETWVGSGADTPCGEGF